MLQRVNEKSQIVKSVTRKKSVRWEYWTSVRLKAVFERTVDRERVFEGENDDKKSGRRRCRAMDSIEFLEDDMKTNRGDTELGGTEAIL